MELNNDKRFFLRFVSILSMLEALAWSLMSIIAIVIYLKQPKLQIDEDTSYARLISINLYYRFLYDPEDSDSSHDYIIVNTTVFQIFMWFYLILNLCWIINSYLLFLVSKVSSKNSTKTLGKRMKIWSGNITIICILDLIFLCILARDYDYCPSPVSKGMIELLDINSFICHQALGIVLVLAAKGFVLWFINFGSALTISYLRYNMIVSPKININEPFTPYFSIPRILRTNGRPHSSIITYPEPSNYVPPELETNLGQLQPYRSDQRYPGRMLNSEEPAYGQLGQLGNGSTILPIRY